MGHIFVSYSRKDEKYVKRLIETLESEGFDVWYDREMLTGEEWIEAINQKIDECAAFVIVMTDNSKDSKWVRREVLYAMQEGKKVFPLLRQGKLWMLLQDVNYFSVTDGALPDEKFFRQLAKFTSRTPAVTPRPKPPQPRLPRQPLIDPQTVLKVIGGIVALLLVVFGISRLGSYTSQNESVTPELTATLLVKPTSTLTFTPALPTETSIPIETAVPTITPTPLPVEITDEKGIRMNLVPAGTFKMGSEKYDDEKPIHDVYLDAFYMDMYEVTNAAYKNCVDAGKCELPSNADKYNDAAYAEHPVVYVNWNQAKTYCEWRGSRLPTEAEWEKAARGVDGRTYPWGEGIDCSKANYYGCVRSTSEVGSYESGKSPYGIYDMAGNAREWVNDWYDENYYQNSPASNPLGPSSGQYRVLRGGSWYYSDNLARSAYRFSNSPDLINFNFGFRCARSLP
jgi:formylglycine-generating enzyme required for sulfatase activity